MHLAVPSSDVTQQRADRSALRTVVFALLYGTAAALTRRDASLVSLVWPAAGIAVLWMSGSWGRPRAVARDGALLVAATVVAYLLVGAPVLRAVGVGGIAVVQALVACAVLHGLGNRRPARLVRPGDLTTLLLASTVSGLVSALVAPTVLAVVVGPDAPPVGWSWMLRTAVSTLLVVAVGLRLRGCLQARRVARARREPVPDADLGLCGSRRTVVVEALAIVLAFGIAYELTFVLSEAAPLAFAVLPLSVWVGLRMPTTWAAGLMLGNGAAVVLLTAVGRGPFAGSDPDLVVALAQGLIAVVALVTLTLALHRDELQAALARVGHEHARAQEQADLLSTVFASINDGVVVVGPSGQVLLDNPAAQRLLGVGDEQAPRHLRDRPYGLLHLDGTPYADDGLPLARALAGESTTGVELVARHAVSGRERLVSISARPLPGPVGEHGAVAAVRDVTDERRTAAELAESERVSRLALDTSSLGMLVLALDGDRRGTVLRANAAVLDLTGLDADALVGADVAEVVDPTDAPLLRETVAEMARTGAGRRLDLRLRGARGERVHGACSASVVRGAGGEPQAMLVVEDVTTRREAEAALAHQALHDPLTGLANRALLADHLCLGMAGAGRTGLGVGVLLLDLDGFKAVNDAEGHAVGDAVLVETAQRLVGAVRPADTVARLGGDEFVVVCPGVDDVEALRTIGERVLGAIREPFGAPVGPAHRVSASIGLAVSSDLESGEELLRRVDAAMYVAKHDGGDRCSVAGDARVELGGARVLIA